MLEIRMIIEYILMMDTTLRLFLRDLIDLFPLIISPKSPRFKPKNTQLMRLVSIYEIAPIIKMIVTQIMSPLTIF